MEKNSLAKSFGLNPKVQETYAGLDELNREYVSKGIVDEQVYKKLVDDNKKKIEKERKISYQNKKRETSQIVSRVKASGKDKLNKLRTNFSTKRGTSRSRGTSGFSSFSSQNNQDFGKFLVEDYLLRLVVSRFGKRKWKRTYVKLYATGISFYDSKQKSKAKSSYPFDMNSFVSEPLNSNQEEKDEEDSLSINSLENGGGYYEREHVFYIDLGENKIYLSAEDEVKKEYWLSVLEAAFSDIKTSDDPFPVVGKQGKQLSKFLKRQNEAMKDIEKKFPKRDNMSKVEMLKYNENKSRMTMLRVAIDTKTEQNEENKLRLQLEALRNQLRDKENENEQLKQQLEDQEGKFKKLLEEARQRNLEKEDKKRKVEDDINRLRRMSVQRGRRDEDRDFEKEIEALKTKLKALENALNMDIGNLDWDGTLEDAEEKMKLLIPIITGGGSEKEQQEALVEFDQWDNIIRNHADFHKREEEKWTTWEEENLQVNLSALEQMKRIVPSSYKNEKDIIKQTGVKPKVASRIVKNQIFKFFYMRKEVIAKIHEADLMLKYACQGLDIREMRAVYVCLPDEFLNDAKGTKKKYRDTIRDKLFELTKKEKEGKLSGDEKRHNQYGETQIKRAAPKTGVKRVKKKVNGGIAAKANFLENALGAKNSGPPVRKPAKTQIIIPEKEKKLDPNNSKYTVYFNMQARGLPEGAILNKMKQDGLNPGIWDELVLMKQEKKANSSTGAKKVNNPFQEIKEIELKSNFEKQNSFKSKGMVKKKRKKKSRRGKSKSLISSNSVLTDMKMTEKVTRRGRKSQVSTVKGKKLLNSDAKDLLNKVNVDFGKVGARGAHGINLEYATAQKKEEYEIEVEEKTMNKNSRRPSRRKKKKKKKLTQQEVINAILSIGKVNSAEGGLKTISFGELYECFEDQEEYLRAVLMKGKRSGHFKYKGDTLYTGIHDAVSVTVLKAKA
eukprot:maker-scaffold_85-snap-gene-0.42-mRNA-1 protein AED:0.86 eAED:0.86 QI:86/1/0.5/1/1/1/2/0/951